MKRFLEQATHNHDFHDCLIKHFPDTFYDWKITVLFYIALHYLKALMKHRGQKVENTHWDIQNEVNPDEPKAKCKISKTAYKNYYKLKQYSENARYEGVIDEDIQVFEESCKLDYSYC